MSHARTSFGKLQRAQQKREKAKDKAERRATRQALEPEENPEPVLATEAELIDQLATLHQTFEAGGLPLSDFEERREHIRGQLERLQS